MATSQILQVIGTPILWTNSTYSPGTNTILGTRSASFDIDIDGLTTGQARMSLKGDLGAAHAASFSVDMTVEPATDPTDGDTIDLYWSESHSVTAAVGNMGGTTGADADYAGYSTLSLAASLRQLIYIGSLQLGVANDLDGVQIGHVGIFSPVQRWGVLVVHNNSAITLHDSVEAAVRFTPIIPDIQAAA